MSVEVSHLSKIYGEQYAVNDISFKVGKGQILGFLGPNGAGKSTTMKMLTGYLPPASGAISVAGINMLTDALEGRRHIGYLPENNPLYLDMYVKEFLSFISEIYKLGKNGSKAIADALEMTGLGPEQHKTIRQLSKGYKQRVGLAQALIHNPEVLILDEPTTGLDPIQLGEIRSLIRALGKEKTIIFSTHIMQEVQAVCDRVLIINKGKIVADNTVEGINQQIKGYQSVLISFEYPIEISMLNTLTSIDQVLVDERNQYKISGEDALTMKRELFHLATTLNNPILNLSDEKADLEAVFKQLTQGQKVS